MADLAAPPQIEPGQAWRHRYRRYRTMAVLSAVGDGRWRCRSLTDGRGEPKALGRVTEMSTATLLEFYELLLEHAHA